MAEVSEALRTLTAICRAIHGPAKWVHINGSVVRNYSVALHLICGATVFFEPMPLLLPPPANA